LIHINASDFETEPNGGRVGRGAQQVIQLRDFSRHQKGDEMGSWLVPPIVIPVLIVIMVVVYGLYRAYS
jgi:hypothetical protein